MMDDIIFLLGFAIVIFLIGYFVAQILIEFIFGVTKDIIENITYKKSNNKTYYNTSNNYSEDTNSSNNNNYTYTKNNSETNYNYNSKKYDTYSTKKEKEPEQPYIRLYEVIKKSKETGKEEEYAYGTYVKNGKLYDNNGFEIIDKEKYFEEKEKRFIKNNGYDKKYFDKKNEKIEKLNKYLDWKKRNKKINE